jgi:hypothetical protein
VSRTRLPAVAPAVRSVEALIRTRSELVDTDHGAIRVTQPCLLHMLTAYLLRASKNGGRGAGALGTIPLDSTAWDLLVEIRYDTYAWAKLLGINPEPYAHADTPRPGKPATPPIGKLLRAVAHEAERVARQPVADAITTCARRWARQITEMLAGQPEQRGVRGATCPACATTEILEERDDVDRWPPRDGCRTDGKGSFRTPAIVCVAADEPDEPSTLVCLACGWWSPLGLALVDTPDQPVDEDPAEAA